MSDEREWRPFEIQNGDGSTAVIKLPHLDLEEEEHFGNMLMKVADGKMGPGTYKRRILEKVLGFEGVMIRNGTGWKEVEWEGTESIRYLSIPARNRILKEIAGDVDEAEKKLKEDEEAEKS